MSRRVSKELRELGEWAARFGWSAEMTKSSHVKWTHPDVPAAVFSPHTPRTPDSAKPRQKMAAAYRQATGREMARG